MKGNTLEEVVEYGPICAASDELGILITVNGAYLNAWVSCGDGSWSNTECRGRNQDLYNTTGAEMIDEAKEYLEELLASEEDEKPFAHS